LAAVVTNRVPQGNQTCDEADAEQSVECRIEDVPEADIKPPDFPELADLVKYEPSCHEIEYTLYDV